ncbi:MAG TPA: glycosyltransferase family 4 protein, partial [Candidatus Competibacteraceae bacterium]|nr:glycosyltransferase family 4 protein [Candidatus Competibacteraceae bacterium]
LIRHYRALPAGKRPRAWFTYHLYHKAPDWIGPAVAEALAIPYLVAEPSHAPRQADGPWAEGHAAAAAAIGRADALFCLNSKDLPGLRALVAEPARIIHLKPFLDTRAYPAPADRAALRTALAAGHDLDPAEPWLLTVAMMRNDVKLDSYRLLAAALQRLAEQPWRLVAIGDGPARPAVAQAFAPLSGRVCWLGALDEAALLPWLQSADLFVWPAIGEAFGMALLEAQAAGLPVVAGRSGGVADIVAHGHSGWLCTSGDAQGFAAAVAALLADPGRRRAMGEAARARLRSEHDLDSAARVLRAVLERLCP